MKGFLVVITLASLLGTPGNCIEVELEKFQVLAESDSSFMDFGTLRLKKKGRNNFVIGGDFELFQNFGDEYDVSYEILDPNGTPIMKGDKKVCDYMANDDYIWPKVKEASTLTGDCPVVKGKYSMTDFQYTAEKIPDNFPKGKYKLRGYIKDHSTVKAACEVQFELKNDSV